MPGRTIAVALIAVGMLSAATVARANTADVLVRQNGNAADGFQAGPCTTDTPPCSQQTPAQFFKVAGGHPPTAFIQFIVRHIIEPNYVEPGREIPVEPLVEPLRGRIPRSLKVDLPPGLSINPNATPEKCSLAEFLHEERGYFVPECKPGSKIGLLRTAIVSGVPGFLGLPKGIRADMIVPTFAEPDLFNIEPHFGEPALFGFALANRVRGLLRPELSWESDFHESFTLEGLPDFGTLRDFPQLALHTGRLLAFGNTGDGTLATLPTTCFNADEPQYHHLYSSWIRVDSFERPDPVFPFGTSPFESALPAGVHPEGCENVPFDPSVEFDPGSTETDSPAAATVTTRLKVETPGRGGGPIAESQLRSAEVTLPEGLTLNPSGAGGLVTCSDAQFHKGQRIAQNECPEGSAIGTAQIRAPVLSQPLEGRVYLGEQKSADPASGEEFRILVEAKSDEVGVVVRLIGKVKADPQTGQLSASFDEQEVSPLFGALPHGLPQLPFESLTLHFDPGRDLLSTPLTCATALTQGEFEPWARPDTETTRETTFNLSSLPGGGECPLGLEERAFSPLLSAAADNPQGGSFSPFRVHLVRPEGQQELKGIDVALPKGLIGRLAGIPYCPEAGIAAAKGKSGIVERRSPSCSPASQVGTTSTEAGTGGEPLQLPGKVYLAGPYNGAPLSLVAITPAVAGPFDLGNVVIRVALHLDPRSAQLTAVSDPVPDVFGGVRLDLRTIDLNLDRREFTLNPTSCSPQALGGALAGGGGDPTNPALWSFSAINAPFAVSGCNALDFQPGLTTTLSGPTKRHGYPSLTATLNARPGDANIASVALTLPHAFFVAQEHFATVCTRAQLASHSCPPDSVYGEAEASSPLLEDKLRGPVYLVPGGGKLPDLVADLRGQVELQLHGVVGSNGGGIEAVFDSTPDVPVSEFVLRMAGGPKGLIVNSTNICKGKHLASLDIEAQNGKQLKTSGYRLNLTGCRKRPRHKKHRHGKHRRAEKGKGKAA